MVLTRVIFAQERGPLPSEVQLPIPAHGLTIRRSFRFDWSW
jgi:hypothetical protein